MTTDTEKEKDMFKAIHRYALNIDNTVMTDTVQKLYYLVTYFI